MSRTARVAAAALLLAVLASLAWASVSGPAVVGRGSGFSGWASAAGDPTDPPTRDGHVVQPTAIQPPPPSHTSPDRPVTWLPWALGVLLAVGVLALLVLLARRLRELARGLGSTRPRERQEPAPPVPLPPVDEVVVRAQRAALADGSPRNGIVACWVELEQMVADAGTVPRPHETSTELVRRVLTDQHVPADAVADLAELYREARYSRHELGEDARTRARRALDRVHEALGAPPEPSARDAVDTAGSAMVGRAGHDAGGER